MRQSIAAILIAGAAAQDFTWSSSAPNQQTQPSQVQVSFPGQAQAFPGQAQAFPGQAQTFPGQSFPGQGMQNVPQMQTQPQMQGVPQLTQGQGFTLPAGAQGLQQGQQVGTLPQQAQTGLTTANLAPQVRGIPIGTAHGITDSDRACDAGVLSACGLPDVNNLWNKDPSKRIQTQQSDQLLWQLFETGNYAANGQRVANQNPVGIDIPYYQTGNLNGGNFGAVYTVDPNDPFRRPVNSLVNYVTNDPRAPEGFRPSASNAVLPSSAAYLYANANPQGTTPVNTVTGAGFGYSDKINAPGTSPVYTGGWNQGLGNWNMGQTFLGGNVGAQGFLGNVGQNLGYFGNGVPNWNLGGVPTQNWNLGTQGFLGNQGYLAPRTNLGFNTVNTGLRPRGGFTSYVPNAAPPTQNRLPTLPNGLTTAPAWTPTTGTGYNGPNVAPQAGQQPRWN